MNAAHVRNNAELLATMIMSVNLLRIERAPRNASQHLPPGSSPVTRRTAAITDFQPGFPPIDLFQVSFVADPPR